MPIVSISLCRGKTAAYRRAIADAAHEALVDVVGIPRDERFQLITEFDEDALIYDRNYKGIHRSDDVVLIQITLRKGRSREVRAALHRNIAARLTVSPGIRPDDVFIVLLENDYADWSAGRGEVPFMALHEVYDEL